MTTINEIMKILNNNDASHWLQMHTIPVLTPADNLIMDPIIHLRGNNKVSLHYHFWDHMNKDFPKDKIKKAIEEKDFETFSTLLTEWEYKDGIPYLPDELWVVPEGLEDSYGRLLGVWTKEIFELIDFVECEGG